MRSRLYSPFLLVAATVLLGGVVGAGGIAQAAPSGPAALRLVDIAGTHPGAADGAAEAPSVSADGRYVAFASTASDLLGSPVPGGGSQIYRTDLATRTTILVSQVAGVAGDGASRQPQISDDGQTVAYLSESTNLAAGVGGGLLQLYSWSASGDSTVLLSQAGGLAFDEGVDDFDLAGDGRSTVVSTRSAGVVAGAATNGVHQVYLLGAGAAPRLASDAGSAGTAGFASAAVEPAVSRDGRYVVFRSRGAGSAGGASQIYLRDLVGSTTTLVTVSALGQPGDRDSSSPAISGDGNTIVFVGAATNVASRGEGRAGGVFVKDLRTGRTIQTDVTPSGFWQRSAEPVVSDDGRIVALEAQFLDVRGAAVGSSQAYSFDVATREVTPLSQSRVLEPGNGPSSHVAIAADGRSVVFQTEARNLTPDRYPPTPATHILRATIG